MKKSFKIVSVAAIWALLIAAVWTLCACGLSEAKLSDVEGAELDEQNKSVFLFVGSSVKDVDLSQKVSVAWRASWKLCRDADCTEEIESKVASAPSGELVGGNNLFYIAVTSAMGGRQTVYTLTVHRSMQISVDYLDGTTVLKTENAYSGEIFFADFSPQLTGYAFDGWESDGETFVSGVLWQNTRLVAVKSAKTYVATVDANGGDVPSQTTCLVSYGSTYSLPVLNREGYTFLGYESNGKATVSADGVPYNEWLFDGDRTFTALWQINSYFVAVLLNDFDAGSFSGAGLYDFGTEVTLTAVPNLGYDWLGWYDGDKKLSEELDYTFTVAAQDKSVTAKFQVTQDMQKFYFSSTASECVLTGIKDVSATSLTVPSCVTAIESSAFRNCSSLAEAILPEGLLSIGAYAFMGCVSLKSVQIPSTVTEIFDGAFKDCTALTNFVFGSGVVCLGDGVFENCSALSLTEYDNALYMGSADNLYAVLIKVNDTEIVSCKIHSDTKFVCDKAFFGCAKLSEVTFPENLLSIGNLAFDGCASLAEAALPDSVVKLGDYAFALCTNLVSVTLGSGIAKIGKGAFFCDTSLQNVNFSTTVGWKIFADAAAQSGIAVSEETLVDSAVAAKLLADTYTEFVWKTQIVE